MVGSERMGSRGRVRVYLGKDHPYANSGGWQWRSRFVVMEELGRKLRSDEHVHHINGDRSDDRIENLELLAAEYHGRFHAAVVTLGGYRDDRGRFVEFDEPGPFRTAPRFKAVIGASAYELVC